MIQCSWISFTVLPHSFLTRHFVFSPLWFISVEEPLHGPFPFLFTQLHPGAIPKDSPTNPCLLSPGRLFPSTCHTLLSAIDVFALGISPGPPRLDSTFSPVCKVEYTVLPSTPTSKFMSRYHLIRPLYDSSSQFPQTQPRPSSITSKFFSLTSGPDR